MDREGRRKRTKMVDHGLGESALTRTGPTTSLGWSRTEERMYLLNASHPTCQTKLVQLLCPRSSSPKTQKHNCSGKLLRCYHVSMLGCLCMSQKTNHGTRKGFLNTDPSKRNTYHPDDIGCCRSTDLYLKNHF